jgi:fermentation-respiration switch protein FrsA (DUF1100 family)
MSLSKRIFASLPVSIQEGLLKRAMKSGKILKMPVFKMFIDSLVYYGADRKEIEKTISKTGKKGNLPHQCFIELGDALEAKARGHELSGRNQEACLYYHRASIYYLTSQLFIFTVDDIEPIYRKAIACHDSFRRLNKQGTEKVELSFLVGKLYGFYRVPKTGKPPYPVIIFLQGNNGAKEFNYRLENAALMNGLAVFDFDPCGWGESGLSGNKFRGNEDYQRSISLVIDYLQGREEINPSSIACFGLGFGGGLAHFAHGLDQRVRVSAGIGGPFYDLNRIRKYKPDFQVRRELVYTGLDTKEQLQQWTHDLDYQRYIRQTRGASLIVHGTKDELVPLNHARAMHRAIPGSDLWVREGDDHLCTKGLMSNLAEDIFHWISIKL